jgi:signal transduction histidine kinase/ActR/RegA family two-component response regulator
VIEKSALVAALVLLIGGLAAAWWSDRLYKQQKLADVRVQAEILAASVSAALAFDDATAAQESINAFRVNADIEAVAAYDETGAIIASFARNRASAPPDKVSPGRPYVADGHIIAVTPVTQGGSALGAVYLRSLTMTPASRMLRYGLMALMAFMGALVVAVLSFAHAELRRANADLDQRAKDLSEANAALRFQIDERIRAEEALRQSQKMEAMGQLTGGVAHDFNNLLMAVASGLRLLERAEDPARRSSIVEGIQQAVDRGARLTRQLLAFARRQTLKPESVNPAQRIADMRELLQRSLREDIRVVVDMPPDLWPIEVDPGQLELVIINLAVNARDAMPNGGVLTISGANVPGGPGREHTEDMVCLAVTDTGLGMSPEIIGRAFEPFFTTKDVHKGTGLGLSQVYGFASQSNGSASIQSAPGEGTTVSLLLPRASGAPAAAVEQVVRRRASRPLTALKVLAVEDDETVARMVCALIVQLGHHCSHVPSAGAALDALDSGEEFDLLFSDIVMPGGMNGLELARTVRRLRPELPIVLTTGYSDTAHTVGGEFPILRKPYGPDELQIAFQEAQDAIGRAAGAPDQRAGR